MSSPEAIRQRRYRLHRKGDHSECLAGRCDEAVTDVTSRVTRDDDFGPRGKTLWADVVKELSPGPMQRVMLLEACRIADRLDKLEAQLSGADDEWLRIEPDYEDPTRPVVVLVDKALSEARQQALAMKALLAEIRQAAKPATPAGKPAAATPPLTDPQAPPAAAAGGSNVLSLAAGIAARRTNPTAG